MLLNPSLLLFLTELITTANIQYTRPVIDIRHYCSTAGLQIVQILQTYFLVFPYSSSTFL